MSELRIDEVGYWSEIKLEIVKEYAGAYSTIMHKQTNIRKYLYIDGFAGAGVHISKQTGEYILGSPLNALNIKPPFGEYHFIDMDGGRAEALREYTKNIDNVFVHEGDCNKILPDSVFSRSKYGDYHRALCLLDPYALNLDWKVMYAAGQMKSIEIILNFPVMDMNMNVLWKKPDKVQKDQAKRMDDFWGDHSWRKIAYKEAPTLFGNEEQKEDIRVVAQAFRNRLQKVAGFEYVPDPIPMRNGRGGIIYYLFFASPNKTGGKIMNAIFRKYKDRGAV
ncbi:MAG: three-Cys-motif partner protein TcmP [Planctomycetes bacterium]|nr:three-Cys-motif partner protein TcmP [Planctomycetota bacterium]